MATVQITITTEKIIATPSGYDKNIKNRFASFGGAQKPWKWNGYSWEIEGAQKVNYWADRVKDMFASWKSNPSEVTDNR